MNPVRVAVVGAGLGGLCLAQGLRQAGFDVVVYERDADVTMRRQGYRLHVDARAGLALRECLPPDLFDLFLATCGRPSTRFTVLSERLRVLHRSPPIPDRDPDDPRTMSTSVNRLTLREILLTGLDKHIRYGHALQRFVDDGSSITLHFADGSRTSADVLVGADGVGSAVRRQYLPHAEIVDTSTRCIYGKTVLSERALALVPAPMQDGFTAVIGGPVGMAAGLVRLRNRPDQAGAHLVPPAVLSPADDYLMWAVSARHKHFPVADARLSELASGELHDVAQQMIRTWHPDLRELVAIAERDETFLVRIRTSVPVPAWTPTAVTLLGDAIHAMSPARGSGANTALQDAALLTRTLSAAGTDRAQLVTAIGGYEDRMREYGFAAVLASQQAERANAMHGGGAVLRWLVNHVPRRGGRHPNG